MGSQAIFLVIASSFLHASWNYFAKIKEDKVEHFKHMQIWMLLLTLVPFVVLEARSPSLPNGVWLYLLVSGFFCSLYFFSLANAYEANDFSVAYPSVRAIPVVIVGTSDIFRGLFPSTAGVLGMLMVVIGCMTIPYTSFKGMKMPGRKQWINKWVLMAAIFTAGYSISDKMASEILVAGPSSAFRYAFLFFLSTLIFYLLILRLLGRDGSLRISKQNWKLPLVGGVFSFCTYWLILWAYQLSANAGYVVALRQFSIVLGAVLGVAYLGERGGLFRFASIVFMCFGIVLISLYG